MPARMEVTGLRETARALRNLERTAEPVLRKELLREAEELMSESKKEVPVDTGTLRSSGFVDDKSDGRILIEVGYGGPSVRYAWRVHENPRSGQTGGITPSGGQRRTWATVGKSKYLEDPYNRRVSKMDDRIAQRIRVRLAGMFKGRT